MKCPGQDTQYWTAGAIFDVKCPRCDAAVEFFKDDTSRKCGRCGHRFVNPKMDFGCAAYCQYAEQCLGDLPAELVAQKEALFKDRVAVAVKRHLKTDFKRISRIARRARYAEEIGKTEGANLPLILMAAYLWDLDEGAPGGDLPVARSILAQLKAPESLIGQVCGLIVRRPAVPPDFGIEFKVVIDAERITVLEEESKEQPIARATLEQRIEKECLTAGGRQHARRLLLGLG